MESPKSSPTLSQEQLMKIMTWCRNYFNGDLGEKANAFYSGNTRYEVMVNTVSFGGAYTIIIRGHGSTSRFNVPWYPEREGAEIQVTCRAGDDPSLFEAFVQSL